MKWFYPLPVLMGAALAVLAQGQIVQEEARLKGEAVLASAKWRSPSIAGIQRLWSGSGGPIIVLAETSVTGLSRTDGKKLWQVTEGVEGPYLYGGNDKVVLIRKNREPRAPIVGLSAVDGSEKYQLAEGQGSEEYSVRGDILVVGRDLATPNFGPTLHRRALDPQLTGYDSNTGQQLWQIKSQRVESFNGFVSDRQFMVILDHVMTMVDATTGKKQWERPIESHLRGLGNVIRPDGTWLLFEDNSEDDVRRLSIVDFGTGQTIRTHELRGSIGNAEGSLVDAVGDTLVLQRLRKSEHVRTFDVIREVELTDEDKKEKITAFDLQTRMPKWVVAIPRERETYNSIYVVGDVLLQGVSWDEREKPWTLSALDLANGRQLWSRNEVMDAPVIHKELVILPRRTAMEAVERRTGRTLWSIATNDAKCRPLVEDGVLYLHLGGSEGREGVYAIPLEANAAAELGN